MSDAANEEKRRLLQQRKERLLTELQNVDAQLEECSTDDQGTGVVGTSNKLVSASGDQNIPPATATVATRVICTNRRVENEKRSYDGRWFGGIRAWKPMHWFTFCRTVYSVQAQSTDAAATRADEKNVPPQPDHGDHPPLQLDTGSSSQSSELACDESSSVSQDSANAISATSRPEPGNTFCPDIATVQDHSAADSAQQRRNLKRTYVRMNAGHARAFASSLEALSLCDMKTIHAMADPHIRLELIYDGQYCGPMNLPSDGTQNRRKKGGRRAKKQKRDDARDYFEDYCESVFEDWNACKHLAATLIDAGDDVLLVNMEAYRAGSREDELYDPFGELANRVFQLARQALLSSSKLRSRRSGAASAAKDVPLNLVAVPTYNRPIHGCADKRKPDFAAMHVTPGTESPDSIDARDANCLIELKFGQVVQGQPPKLHDRNSGIAVRSTYGAAVMSHDARLNPHEQLLEYNCVALAAQAALRRYMLGLLITYMRLQIMYADRAGCMISVERDFSDDFGILFAVLIGVYKSEVRRAGLEPAIRVLPGPGVAPLDPSDFKTSDQLVEIGSMKCISRKITPFEVQVQLVSAPAQHVSAFGHGFNMMERPMAVTWEVVQASRQDSTPHRPLNTRPSVSRLAKSKALEEIALLDAESSANSSVDAPRQFAPRYIFGSGTARYHCVFDAETPGAAKSTLQLSWQPKSRLSEATVLRLANECNVPGVPTLIASNDIAELDDGSVRSRLQRTFAALPSIRPVNKVLRALVWKEECVPLSTVVDIDDFLSAAQCVLKAIVQLNELGIMHTNISEANMMALRTEKSRGFLVGFDFALVDSDVCNSSRIRLESPRDSEDHAITMQDCEMSPLIPEQADNDAVPHHVASLALSRYSDYPPVHQFQHELESFIWSVFFILSGFRCGRRIVNTDLEKWYVGDWDSIGDAKRRFRAECSNCPAFAGEFAKSLGVDPEPLMACSQSLAEMLVNPEQLNAVCMLSALQEAQDAYSERIFSH